MLEWSTRTERKGSIGLGDIEMNSNKWEGPIPAPLPHGTREGWRFSVDDPNIRFLWDGSRWAIVRRIQPDGTFVDFQVDATKVEQGPVARGSARHRPERRAFLIGTVTLIVLVAAIGVIGVLATKRSTRQPGLLQVSVAEGVYSKLLPRLDRDLDGQGSVLTAIDKLTDLRNFVAPSARQVIVAEIACGCLQIPRIPPESVEFSIPTQRSYPLSFLAETDNTLYETATGPSYHYVFLTLFEKTAPKASWQITYFLASTTPQSIPSGAVLTGTPPGASSTAQRLLHLFGSAMTRARLFGLVPVDNPWSQVPSNTVVGALFGQLEKDHAADVVSHMASGRPYVVSNFSPTFKTSLGTLQCATVEGSATYYNQVQSSLDGAYGGFLAPGTYASVHVITTRVVCVVVRSGELRETELYGGLWRVIGTRTLTNIR
jgi:hypothetical protein